MRHRHFGRKLGRNQLQRRALFRSQIYSMLTHSAITTTEAKAKALLPSLEKLCFSIYRPEVLALKHFYYYLQDKKRSNRVYQTLKQVYSSRPISFLKITRLYRRRGDDALMVKLAFNHPVNFKEPPQTPKKETTKSPPKEVKNETKNHRRQRQ